jgi:hypothetical protein
MVAQQRLQAFRVMLGRMDATAMWRAHDHRAGEPPAGPVALARHVVGDLVEGRIDEAHELDLGDDLQPLGGHADGHARDHALGERRVLHAIASEALLQTRRGPEHAAIGADVLADEHDIRVARHLRGKRHVDRVDQRDLRHA